MNRKLNLPKLSVAEFEIMKVLWDKSEAPVITILNDINRTRLKPLTRSTIRVQVNRLVEKGWVKSLGEGKGTQYSATVPRQKASLLIADDVKERIFDGSCLELIKALFKSSDISGDEIDEIRALIDKKSNEGE